MTNIGATRLYAASIAIVSGGYSIGSSRLGVIGGMPMVDGVAMTAADWVMLTVGLVVLVHGIVLLTPAAMALRPLSGPLMLVWALVMLANQGLVMVRTEHMMGGMDVDPGMIALAVLMLASGLIMIARPMGGERAR